MTHMFCPVWQVLTTRPREEWRQDVQRRYMTLSKFSQNEAKLQFLKILRTLPYGKVPQVAETQVVVKHPVLLQQRLGEDTQLEKLFLWPQVAIFGARCRLLPLCNIKQKFATGGGAGRVEIADWC